MRPAPVHTTFSPYNVGITMLSPGQAEQWTKEPTTVSPDEVSIFVVGDANYHHLDNVERITAPGFNASGSSVLISGYLINLGEKPITTVGQADEERVQLRDTFIVAVTLWAEDFSEDEWQACVQSPVKFSKQLLVPDNLQHAIRNPFGRAFRRNREPASPQTATSVQYHSEVWAQDLRKLLRRSGFNKCFITPKNEQGRPSEQWRPIWVQLSQQALEAKTASMPGLAGFIRGARSCGVRVEASSFEASWKLLRPDTPLPAETNFAKTWKIQPFPWGLDRDILCEWLETLAWKAAPIKPLGAKAWLFGSNDPPPKGIVCFNQHPLLVKETQPRSSHTKVGIIAGPRSQSASFQAFRTGDPHYDPWAQAAEIKSNNMPGPSAQRFDHQDQRLDQLEKSYTALQEQQTQYQQQNDAKVTALGSDLRQHAQQTQEAFSSLRRDFETTLHSAMGQQEQKLSHTLSEIKQLLLRNDKRKAAPTSDEELT